MYFFENWNIFESRNNKNKCRFFFDGKILMLLIKVGYWNGLVGWFKWVDRMIWFYDSYYLGGEEIVKIGLNFFCW